MRSKGSQVVEAQDTQVSKPKNLPENVALELDEETHQWLESWQQHPHWGLPSAASLQDARPGALGHRQSREYLREETA